MQGLNAGIRYAVKANGTLAVLQLLACLLYTSRCVYETGAE